MINRESLLERYENIETIIKGLFTNCTSIWNSYNKKHSELTEVYNFLKQLTDAYKAWS